MIVVPTHINFRYIFIYVPNYVIDMCEGSFDNTRSTGKRYGRCTAGVSIVDFIK